MELVVLREGYPTNSYQLDQLQAEQIRIGRDISCEICIIDPQISRIHCQLVKVDNQWSVKDLGSRNGTIINGIKITRASLHHLDLLMLGNVLIRVLEQPTEPQADTTKIKEVAPIYPIDQKWKIVRHFETNKVDIKETLNLCEETEIFDNFLLGQCHSEKKIAKLQDIWKKIFPEYAVLFARYDEVAEEYKRILLANIDKKGTPEPNLFAQDICKVKNQGTIFQDKTDQYWLYVTQPLYLGSSVTGIIRLDSHNIEKMELLQNLLYITTSTLQEYHLSRFSNIWQKHLLMSTMCEYLEPEETKGQVASVSELEKAEDLPGSQFTAKLQLVDFLKDFEHNLNSNANDRNYVFRYIPNQDEQYIYTNLQYFRSLLKNTIKMFLKILPQTPETPVEIDFSHSVYDFGWALTFQCKSNHSTRFSELLLHNAFHQTSELTDYTKEEILLMSSIFSYLFALKAHYKFYTNAEGNYCLYYVFPF